MKKIIILFSAFSLLFFTKSIAGADFTIQEPVAGEFVVLDTHTNLMWLKDANYAGTLGYLGRTGPMKWDEAMTWAANLDYAGFDDWRLPSALNADGSGPCAGYNCSDSEMGHLRYIDGVIPFSNPTVFDNLQAENSYWSSTLYSSDYAWHFDFTSATQYTNIETSWYYAWAVREATVVPEPISSTLFIIGGASLGIRNYLRKKWVVSGLHSSVRFH